MRVSKHRLVPHYTTQAEVTKFDILIGVKEYITRLEISMKNFVSIFSHMAL